jgi:HSP20 family protein
MPNVARYDPFDLLEGMMKSVMRPHYENAVARQRDGQEWTMPIPIDVAENDKSYMLWAELPGVKKEDVIVSITGSQVTLTAEVKRENPVDQGQGKEVFLVNERRAGRFHRELQFGAEIDDSKAQAQYHDGVLELSLPKKESAQVRRISVN